MYIPRLRQGISKPLIGALGLPTFHMMGFCYQVLMPLYGLITTGIFAPTVTRPDVVPIFGTAENIIEAAKIVRPTCIIAVPTFFHTWSQSDDAVEFLRTLQFLVSPILPIISTSDAISHIGLRGRTSCSTNCRIAHLSRSFYQCCIWWDRIWHCHRIANG